MASVTEEYNRKRTGDGLRLAWIEKAVNVVPAVQQWIPVTVGLPMEKQNENTHDFEYVLCTTTFGDVRPYKFGCQIGAEKPHFWHGAGNMDDYVIAWMPLPLPYKEEQ